MLTVALTGNAASGKSTVARIWAEAGVPVVSADELAREAVAPGTEGLRQVLEAFGRELLTEEGTLDRAALRERVFRDEEERRRLEEILHPRIRELRDRWVAERRREGAELVVSEIPLLFETGLEREFDVSVHVSAPEDVRLRRLVRERGLDPEEARRITEAQMEDGVKRELADFVLVNDSTVQKLRMRALYLLDLLRARADRRAAP